MFIYHRRNAFKTVAVAAQYATWGNFTSNTVAANNGVEKVSGGSAWNSSAETQTVSSTQELSVSQLATDTTNSVAMNFIGSDNISPLGDYDAADPSLGAYKNGSSFRRVINGTQTTLGVSIAIGDRWGIRRTSGGDFEWYINDTVHYTYASGSSVVLPQELRVRVSMYEQQEFRNVEVTGTWALPVYATQYATWGTFTNTVAASNGVQKNAGGTAWNATAETEDETAAQLVSISQVSTNATTFVALGLVQANGVARTAGSVHPESPAYSALKYGTEFWTIINGVDTSIGGTGTIPLGATWGVRRNYLGDFEWFVNDTVHYTLDASSSTMTQSVRGHIAVHHEHTVDNILVGGTGWHVPVYQYGTWYNHEQTSSGSNGLVKSAGGSSWNASAETRERTSTQEVSISQVASNSSVYATLAFVGAETVTTPGVVHPTTPAYSAYKFGTTFYRIVNGSSTLISGSGTIPNGARWGIRRLANGDFEWFVDSTVYYTLAAASSTMPQEVRARAALYHEQTLDNIQLEGTGWAIPQSISVPLNDGSGTTAASTEFGVAGPNLTLGSAVTWATSPDRVSFDGTANSYVDSAEDAFAGSIDATNFTTKMTVLLRITPAENTGFSVNQTALNYGRGGTGEMFTIATGRNTTASPNYLTVRGSIRAGGTYESVSDNYTDSVDTEVAVALRYDDPTMDLIIAGVVEATASHSVGGNLSIPTDDERLTVGAQYGFGVYSNHFDGDARSVELYPVVLTLPEIVEIQGL